MKYTSFVLIFSLLVLGAIVVDAAKPPPVPPLPTFRGTRTVPAPPANDDEDPDLPGFDITGQKSITTFQPGTLIIDMGANFQKTAYGLVAHLLWQDIPMQWIIHPTKAHAGVDVTARVYRVWPDPQAATAAANVAFTAGPFFIPARYAPYAWPHIQSYTNGAEKALRSADTSKVHIYNLTTAVDAHVRHNMTSKPFVGSMDSSSHASIQVTALEQAGFRSGVHFRKLDYNEANSVSQSTCLSILMEPHFATSNPLGFVKGMRAFVESGGNFLAQCSGAGTYEMCHTSTSVKQPVSFSTCPDGLIVTTAGYKFRGSTTTNRYTKGADSALVNYHPSTPYGQYIGTWTTVSSVIDSMSLYDSDFDSFDNGFSRLNSENSAYWALGTTSTGTYDGWAHLAAHAKLKRYHGLRGGNVFHMAGHQFDTNLAGYRLFMNSALIPSGRACTATITLSDGSVEVIGDIQIDPCKYGGDDCDKIVRCEEPHYTYSVKSGSNYLIDLVYNDPVTLDIEVEVPNRVTVFVLVDHNNLVAAKNNFNEVRSIQAIIPYMYNKLSTFNKVAFLTGYLSAASNVGNGVFTNQLALTYSLTKLNETMRSSIPTYVANSGNSNILSAIQQVLQGTPANSWDRNQRAVHVITRSPFNPAQVAALRAVMQTTQTPVVISTTSALVSSYAGLNLPRTSVVAIIWPDLTPTSTAAATATSANTLNAALAAQNTLLGNIEVEIASDPLNIATGPSAAIYNLPQLPSVSASMATISSQLFKLPTGYGIVNGPSHPQPYTLTYQVRGYGGPEVSTDVRVTWKEFAKAVDFTATATESVDFTLNIASKISFSPSEPSRIATLFRINSITRNGASAVNDFGSILGFGQKENNVAVTTGKQYNVDGFKMKAIADFGTDKVRTYTIAYTLYDRCLPTEGVITLTVNAVNRPPIATTFEVDVITTVGNAFSFTTPADRIGDRETPKNLLTVTFNTVTFKDHGDIQVNVNNGGWSTARAGTAYTVGTTQFRFFALLATPTTADSTVTTNYFVTDNHNPAAVSGTAQIHFNFNEPYNAPPTVSVTPTTVSGKVGSSTTFKVTISDDDSSNDFHVDTSSGYSIKANHFTRLRPTGAAYELLTTAVSPTVTKLSTVQLSSGVSEVTFEVIFNLNGPFAETSTFNVYAVDPKGQRSANALVTLRTDPNQVPTVESSTGPTGVSMIQSGVANHAVEIVSSDPDTVAQSEALTIRLMGAPALGRLFLPNSANPDQSSETEVKLNEEVLNARKVAGAAGKTTFKFFYRPTALKHGLDFFTVRVTDPLGAVSTTFRIDVSIAYVNFPPTSRNYNFGTNDATDITFTIQASDPNDDGLEMIVVETVARGAITRGGAPVADNHRVPRSVPSVSKENWAVAFKFSPAIDSNKYEVVMRYKFSDGLLESPVYEAKISVDGGFANLPPVTFSQHATTDEDVPLVLDLDPSFSDPDNPNDTIDFFVGTTVSAASGKLITTGGAVVANGGEVKRNPGTGQLDLTFVPSPDWHGTATFTFHVQDPLGLLSNVSTYTIVVNPVDDPPVITVTPVERLLVDRLTVVSFAVTITDIDSTTVTAYLLKEHTLPALSEISTDSLTPLFPITTDVAMYTGVQPAGTPHTFNIHWKADAKLPDGSSGKFTLYAVDAGSTRSLESPTQTVSVQPNKVPTLIPLHAGSVPPVGPAGVYTVTVPEDTAHIDIVLEATDGDAYNIPILTFQTHSLPSALPFFVTTVSPPATAPGPLATPTYEATKATTSVRISPPADWNGRDTFTVSVKDHLSQSSVITIVVDVTPVNDAPTTTSVTILAHENLCFDSSSNCPSYTSHVTLTAPQINAADIDFDALTLTVDDSAIGNGKLYYLDGNALKLVSSSDKSFKPDVPVWQFLYQPDPSEKSTCDNPKAPTEATCQPFVTIPFSVSDGGLSASGTITVKVFPVNQAPFGSSFSVTTAENVAVSIDLPTDCDFGDSDDDVSVLTATITGVDASSLGTFTDSAGTKLDFGTIVDLPSPLTVTFTPHPHIFSHPSTTPVGRFSFRVKDPQGAESPEYSVWVYVTPVADPIVHFGPNETTIDEDTQAVVSVGHSPAHWTSYDKGHVELSITGYNAPATSIFQLCQLDACVTLPANVSADEPFLFTNQHRIVFTPGPDEYGSDYATFTYQIKLFPQGIDVPTVKDLSYTIHVLPVNDPPFFSAFPKTVTLEEDNTIAFTFKGGDIDTDLADIRAVLVQDFDGDLDAALYACESENPSDDCSTGQSVVTNAAITSSGPGVWTISVVPAANVNGRGYLAFILFDDHEAASAVAVTTVVVLPINDAPVITGKVLRGSELETNLAGDVVGFSVEVSDIDFTLKDLTVTVTEENSLGYFAIEAASTVNSPCTLLDSGKKVKCTANPKKLGQWLALVRYVLTNESALDRSVIFDVDDLSNVDYRPNQNLFAQANFTIIPLEDVIPVLPTPGTPNDGTGLILGLIGGLLAGVLIFVAIFFIFKKRSNAQVNDYFQNFALELEGSATASPLYEGGAKGGENRLYNAGK